MRGSLCQKGTLEEQRRQRRLQELADFNDELAGRDTGKAKKQGRTDDADRASDDERDVMEAMELAAMVWGETFDRIAHQLNILDEASRTALRDAKREVEQIEQQATVLPDGRRVYLSRDGKEAYYEDGTRMSDKDREAVQWRPGAPSWEARQEARQRVEEIERYRQRLEEARQRLQNATPETMSQEDLERLEGEAYQNLPAAVRKEHDRLMAERPDPPSRAALQSQADSDLSDIRAAPVVTPKMTMPTPG